MRCALPIFCSVGRWRFPPHAEEQAPTRKWIVEQVANRAACRAVQAGVVGGTKVQKVANVERERQAPRARDGKPNARAVKHTCRNFDVTLRVLDDASNDVEPVTKADSAIRPRQVRDEVVCGSARERWSLTDPSRRERALTFVRGRERR